MIRVVRIMGESVNLETGEETQKAIVLSNGSQEVEVFADERTIAKVIALLQPLAQQLPPAPRTVELSDDAPTVDEEFDTAYHQQPAPKALALPLNPMTPEFLHEYREESTGVGSI
jgi:hypothetical protein